MSLKMAAFCPDASLEMLQGDLCHCFHEGSPQALQVVVMLSASHVLQNSPQFISRGLRSGLPKGRSSVLINAGTHLCSHS